MGFIKKALGTISIIISMRIGSGFAAEINQYNIIYPPYNCDTSAISCDLGGKSISSIADNTFINHTILVSLNLGHNVLTGISAGAFNGLSQLKELDLSQNLFNRGGGLSSVSFSSIPNLEKLVIIGDRYRGHSLSGELIREQFVMLPELKYLDLKYNIFTNIAIGAFSGLGKLTYLNLNEQLDGITLSHGMFFGLSNLTGLYMSQHAFRDIDPDAFSGLPKLEVLDISYGRSSNLNLKAGTFVSLSGLITLNLNATRISSIAPNTFDGLSNLSYLDIRSNSISTISATMFQGLSNLTRLNLSNNVITSLPSLAFYAMTNLTGLDLSHNNISSMRNDTFIGLSNISSINLIYNNISSIVPGMFNGIPTLASIWLDYNKLSGLSGDTFNELPNLTSIGLKYNQIRSIESGAFNNLPKITSIDLSHNQIRSIESGAFTNIMTQLEQYNNSTIDLSFNELTQINSWIVSLMGSTSITNFNVSHNQISYIDARLIDFLGGRINNFNLSHNQVSYIESGALDRNLYNIDLSYNRLSSILLGELYVQYPSDINLSHNQISYIESGAFEDLSYIQNFNLSYNGIGSLDPALFNTTKGLNYMNITNLCTVNPITITRKKHYSLTGTAGPTDNMYCSIINSTNQASFVTSLTSRFYTGDSSLLIGTGMISFAAGITNKMLVDTIMRSENTNNDTGDYYTDTVEIQYTNNTAITQNGNSYTGILYAPYLFGNSSVPGLTGGAISVMRFGSFNGKIDFDKNITVRMPARGKNSGDVVAIYSSEDKNIFGGTGGNWTHEKNVVVVSLSGKSYAQFTTNHASRWAISSSLPVDNTPPIGTISYSTTGTTYGTVTATITLNELGTITNNQGNSSYLFTGNGTFAFSFKDTAGNTASSTATVDWIIPGLFELNSGNVTDFCETGAVFCLFENTNISSIAAKTFANHPNLESVTFQYNNRLTNIESGAFVGVPETFWLMRIENNKNLTSIKNGALSSLPNITHLYLESNGINSIESGAFIGNYSLEYLFLSKNNITNIKPGTFRDLEGLKELHIENNNISSINSGDFIGLSNIKKIRLNDNHLNTIKEDDLINLRSAEWVNLKNNQISYIDINSFQGMKVTSLNLGNNEMSSINGIFKDMPALYTLDLDNNHILSIDPNTFSNLPKIILIDLHNNNIIDAEGPILDSANLLYFSLTGNCHYDPLTSVYDSYNTGYYYFIQYGITGSSSAVYSTNCALIKSINPNTFIAELKLRGYTGDSSILLGTGAIRFKGQNKILVNTIMYDLQDYSGIEDRTVEVEYPSNTSISKNGLAFSEVLNAPTLFDPTNAPGLTGGAISLMRFGSLQGRIDFDKNITIRMPAYGKDIGDIIGIYSSEDESIYAPDGGNRTYEKTGTVIGLSGRSYVEFTTNHASRWALGDTPDITAPIGTVSYSNTNPTSGNVIATVTLNETGVITNNGGNSYYVFTGNGTFTFEFRDIAGNTGTKIATVSNIDKTGPIGDISYSTTEPINAIVVATLTLNESGVITNNSGENTVAFASNGNFTFQFRDTLGNTGIAIATVSNIDKNLPPGSITYSTKTPTSGNVTAILTLSETGTITNNGGSNTYIFSDNGSFTFEFRDNRGDSRSITASVSNIDRTRPIGTISYSTTNVTNENVTATLMLNETGTITSIGGNSHMFTNNGNFTFTFIDLAGNTGSVTANVNWINPDWRITFNITGNTNNNVISTIHFKDTGTITNNGGLNSYTFTNNGSFTFEFIDKTGRNNSEIVNVNWIDKTSPMGSISYSTTGYISGDVTATLALNEIGTITNNNGSNIYTFKDNGSFTFEFRDLAGNTGSTTAVVNSIFNGFIGKTRDNKIVTSGGIYNTGIIFTFNDNNGVAATVDGNIYKSGSIISSEGINKDFILTDKDGNTTGMIFSIDTTKPICSTNSESIYSGIYLILNWNCTDNNDNDSGLSGIMLVIKDATDKVMYSSGLDISTREINYYTDSGKYNWEIIAEDKAGNKTVVKSNSNYHKTLDMTITYPGTLIDDTYYTNNPNITIKMVANMWLGFEVIGDTKNITTQGYVTGTLNKNIDLLNENGFNEIKINYLSLEESGAIGPISFYIDSIKPKITSLYPTPLLNITGTTMDFSRTANDTGAGISGYILTLTKNNYTNVIYTGQESSYRADKLSNGTYTWKVSAIDYAGNIDETETQTFKISSTVTIDDVSPDEFTLTEQNDRKVYYKYKSNKITVTGLSENVEIIASVNSGTLIINGTESGTSGYVQNGDKIQIEIYSSREFNDTTSGVLTIGDKSGTFILTTIEDESGDSTNAYDITELSTIQKLRIGLIYNSLSKLYKDSAKEDFMVTLKALIKDKIDKMEDSNKPIQSVETMKYLYNLINKDYEASEIDTSNISYIAPNSKEYSIKYIIGDGYTSPNFIRSGKYFDTLNEIKKYIDTNNPKSPYRMVDFSIDTNRDKVDYIAPNGKKYIIFKTTDDRYGSNNFIYGKLFKGLSEIKKYIDEKNT